MNREMRRASKAHGKKMIRLGWSEWEDDTIRYREVATKNGSRLASEVEYFLKNNCYTVQIFLPVETSIGRLVKLGIRRNDEGKIHSWGDLFRIKNEVMGPDRVAIEFYPSTKELVDCANMYWLWVFAEGFQCPVKI